MEKSDIVICKSTEIYTRWAEQQYFAFEMCVCVAVISSSLSRFLQKRLKCYVFNFKVNVDIKRFSDRLQHLWLIQI